MRESQALFAPGQLVAHRLFGYRGVVFDVDPTFRGSDEWYERNARSRPPRDRPWYRVLVDERPVETYVAERNLEREEDPRPIRHPLVDQIFSGFEDGRYVPRGRHNSDILT